MNRMLIPHATLLATLIAALPAQAENKTPTIAFAIHGGAGTISREKMDETREAAFRSKLTEAVTAGHQVLADGGLGVDAVRAAINILEDSPLFNAGKGAVFTADGTNELDASVMDGATRNAGAVAGVRHIRNPIDLAISVMSDSRHVMLSGEGAEAFAREQGFEMVDPAYFYTEHRWEALERAREGERDAAASRAEPPAQTFFSTVGAVALDAHGNLAAGTSTGGMTNKRWGRIGDSPVIGAGTFADNASCAVSATGHGEFFIRWVVAYDICQRVAHGATMAEAAGSVVNDVLVAAGGTGGVISLDAAGNIAMPFNTEGMYRASINSNGELYVGIYGDE